MSNIPSQSSSSSPAPRPSGLKRFDLWWWGIRRWMLALWISRASAANVLLGAVLFSLADAVHDIFRGLAQDIASTAIQPNPQWYRLFAFFFGAFLWATTVHYTARVLLWFDLGMLPASAIEREKYRRAFKNVPRALGALVFVSIVIGLVLTSRDAAANDAVRAENIALLELAALVLVEGVLFLVYAAYRERLAHWTGGLAKSAGRAAKNVAGSTIAVASHALKRRGPVKTTGEAGKITLSYLWELARQASARDNPKEYVRERLQQAGQKALSVASVIAAVAISMYIAAEKPSGVWKLFSWIRIKANNDLQPMLIPSAARNLQIDGLNNTYPIQTSGKYLVSLGTTLLLVVGVGFGGFLWAISDPLSLAEYATQSGILFLILLTWLPLFSIFVFLDHWRRFPILLPIGLLCLLAQLVPGDLHALRLRADGNRPVLPPAQTRPTLDQAATAWGTVNRGEQGKAVPLIIVATAGGGSRAAYWTATVLGALQDADEHFRTKLFAVSAVSGGALGAGVFAALLRHEEDLGPGQPLCPNLPQDKSDRFKSCGQTITAGDFLAPPIAAMGYQDALYWAVPIPISPDRATVIERAWEDAWRRAAEPSLLRTDSGLFADSFLSFVPDVRSPRWRPALVFNGTSVGTGKRIIAGNLNFKRGAEDAPVILDAFDLFDLLPGSAEPRLRLSTAVTVAARFPYVLPPGSIGGGAKCSDRICDRVVDGGYFENFGATTAEEILAALMPDNNVVNTGDGTPPTWLLADGRTRAYPVIIQISSDPDFDANELEPSVPQFYDTRTWTEIVAPPETLMNTRSARGVFAMQALQRRASALHVPFIHFSLHEAGSAGVMPLSWSLSNAAQTEINGRLCNEYNRKELKELGSKINVPELPNDICSH